MFNIKKDFRFWRMNKVTIPSASLGLGDDWGLGLESPGASEKTVQTTTTDTKPTDPVPAQPEAPAQILLEAPTNASTTSTTSEDSSSSTTASPTEIYTIYPILPVSSSQTREVEALLKSFLPVDKEKSKNSINRSSTVRHGVRYWRVALTREQVEIVRRNKLVSSIDGKSLRTVGRENINKVVVGDAKVKKQEDIMFYI